MSVVPGRWSPAAAGFPPQWAAGSMLLVGLSLVFHPARAWVADAWSLQRCGAEQLQIFFEAATSSDAISTIAPAGLGEQGQPAPLCPAGCGAALALFPFPPAHPAVFVGGLEHCALL